MSYIPVTASGLTVSTKSYYQRTILYDNTLGSAGTWDVSSIDQSYDHLEIILSNARCTANSSGSVQNVQMSINNDTTDANYDEIQIQDQNSTVSGGTNSTRNTGVVPGDDATAGRVALIRVFIPNYAGSTYKAYHAEMSTLNTTSFLIFRYFAWKSTSAINRVTVVVNNATNTFVTGSRLQIIGHKAETVVTGVS